MTPALSWKFFRDFQVKALREAPQKQVFSKNVELVWKNRSVCALFIKWNHSKICLWCPSSTCGLPGIPHLCMHAFNIEPELCRQTDRLFTSNILFICLIRYGTGTCRSKELDLIVKGGWWENSWTVDPNIRTLLFLFHVAVHASLTKTAYESK